MNYFKMHVIVFKTVKTHGFSSFSIHHFYLNLIYEINNDDMMVKI